MNNLQSHSKVFPNIHNKPERLEFNENRESNKLKKKEKKKKVRLQMLSYFIHNSFMCGSKTRKAKFGPISEKWFGDDVSVRMKSGAVVSVVPFIMSQHKSQALWVRY